MGGKNEGQREGREMPREAKEPKPHIRFKGPNVRSRHNTVEQRKKWALAEIKRLLDSDLGGETMLREIGEVAQVACRGILLRHELNREEEAAKP